jgi:hypothetical protein
MLLDVQRVYFPWLAEDAATRGDGEYAGVVGEERVVESVRGGRLVERRFTRVDGRPAGTIAVRYEWGRDDWHGPSRAVLENGWFGYGLAIDTLAETRLPPPGAESGCWAAVPTPVAASASMPPPFGITMTMDQHSGRKGIMLDPLRDRSCRMRRDRRVAFVATPTPCRSSAGRRRGEPSLPRSPRHPSWSCAGAPLPRTDRPASRGESWPARTRVG